MSGLRGTVYVDTRLPVTKFDAQVGLIPVVFDGLRGSFPALPAGGSIRGDVHAAGTSDRFALEVDLHGTAGHVTGTG